MIGYEKLKLHLLISKRVKSQMEREMNRETGSPQLTCFLKNGDQKVSCEVSLPQVFAKI